MFNYRNGELVLTDNQTVLKLLYQKREEYTKRLHFLIKKHFVLWKPPEQLRIIVVEYFKLLILDKLLKNKKINILLLAEEVITTEISMYEEEFFNAFKIIKDYNETGGQNLFNTVSFKIK